MPSEVPMMDDSISCTPRALPASKAFTQPVRIMEAKGTLPPVCTTTGPATTMMGCLASRQARIKPAVWRTRGFHLTLG